MKALAVMVLAYQILILILSKMQPIPFVGFLLSQMIYPFAARISWLELLEIYLCFHFLNAVLSVDGLLLGNQLYSSAVLSSSSDSPLIQVFSSIFLPAYFMMLPVIALLNASLMKLIGVHFHPKMLRRLNL